MLRTRTRTRATRTTRGNELFAVQMIETMNSRYECIDVVRLPFLSNLLSEGKASFYSKYLAMQINISTENEAFQSRPKPRDWPKFR